MRSSFVALAILAVVGGTGAVPVPGGPSFLPYSSGGNGGNGGSAVSGNGGTANGGSVYASGSGWGTTFVGSGEFLPVLPSLLSCSLSVAKGGNGGASISGSATGGDGGNGGSSFFGSGGNGGSGGSAKSGNAGDANGGSVYTSGSNVFVGSGEYLSRGYTMGSC